jgi:hypothetical protein
MIPVSCAVLALFGCTSRPLDFPAAEDDTSNPPAPLGASEGDFRPLAAYPPGPYGSELRAVIENHAFLGWRDPVRSGFDPNRLERIEFADFYDPRGGGTELIVVNASAVWCPACRSEMLEIDRGGLSETYRQRKVVLFGTLFEDRDFNPAKPEDLALWGNGLNFFLDFPLALDPGLKLGPYFAQSVTPLNLVIDARTMEILFVQMGYSPSLWAFVDSELARRGVP